ncbi:PspC domain-containing protein [Lentibacillus sp. L22]|uniref:PspC domain-containing protein n=1 Tax=Lentibacillus TaxID=175304 RepID=UPI0022B14B41|nr:PspC domain-containing protein [Lentibacillus daqui]
MPKRLTRSIRDRKVAGVLGGIAEYFNIDSTIVRLAFVILLITSFFTLTLIYLLAVFIMPNDGEVY